MVQMDQPVSAARDDVLIVRHRQVQQKLQVSSATLFDMVAKGLFPKPFPIVPGGRAVGWLSTDVDHWILERQKQAAALK